MPTANRAPTAQEICRYTGRPRDRCTVCGKIAFAYAAKAKQATLHRLHVTSTPLGKLRRRHQLYPFKPCGLWYGIGNAWLDWCRDAMPHRIKNVLVYRIVLRSDAHVLRIQNTSDLHAFHTQYSAEPDWKALAQEYDGIELSFYRRGAISAAWYYAWDCRSGCIWHPRAIAEVHLYPRN